MKYYYLLLISIIITPVFSNNLEKWNKLILNGQEKKALELISIAYKNDPLSPYTQYAYALTVQSATEAEKLYKKVIENKKASDSLRSEASYKLGCLYYLQKDFDNAIVQFALAEKYSDNEKNRHMRAQASLIKGDYDISEILWKTEIQNSSETKNSKVSYYLGNTYYMQGKYDKAFNYYSKASTLNNKPWNAPAYIGTYLSSIHSNNSSKRVELYKDIHKMYSLFLESKLLKEHDVQGGGARNSDISSDDDFSNIDFQKQSNTPGRNSQKIFYTLQVGAYLSNKNAKKAGKKMKKFFDNIKIIKEETNKKTYYKVRIGTFFDENEALIFGEKQLKLKKIKYRVIKVENE